MAKEEIRVKVVLSDEELKKLKKAGVEVVSGKYQGRAIFSGVSTLKPGDEFILSDDYTLCQNTRIGEEPVQFIKVNVGEAIKDLYPSVFIKMREEYTKEKMPTGIFREAEGSVHDLCMTCSDLGEAIEKIVDVCMGRRDINGNPVTDGKKYKVSYVSRKAVNTINYAGTRAKIDYVGKFDFVEA